MNPRDAVENEDLLSLPMDTKDDSSDDIGSLKVLSFGIRRGMSFADRRIVYTVNAAILNLVFLSLCFVVINFFHGKPDLVMYNFWLVAVGLLGWAVLASGRHVLSFVVLNVGSAICFLLGGMWFANGAQSLLIVNFLVAVFLTPHVVVRWILAIICGVFFIVVQMSQFQRVENGLEDWRYLTNTILFLLWLALMSELFRRLEERYLKLINERTKRLVQERARVHLEHGKLLQRTRELRAANRMKEKLFSVISHDFRTPLANLQMALEAMGRGDIGREEFRDLEESLSRNLQHAYSSLENLLLWSERQLKGVGIRATAISLKVVAEEAVALLEGVAKRKGIKVDLLVPEEAEVFADSEQIKAVLRNLLSNALKFTPAGGRVEISARQVTWNWMCYVSDSGPGLSLHQTGEILETTRFESTHGTDGEKGFGLGLEICRDFLSQNGGRLWAENGQSGGCFRFSLPISAAQNES